MRKRKQQKSSGRTVTGRSHKTSIAVLPRVGLLSPIAALAANLAERWIYPVSRDSRPLLRQRSGRSFEPLELRQMLAVGLEIEPNNTLETATDLGAVVVEDILVAEHDDWTAIEGEITTPGDDDFFTFELKRGTVAGLFFDIDAQLINTPTPEFVPGNTLDTQITLFKLDDDDVWVQIAQNDDGYDFEGFITPTIPDYVDVNNNPGGTSLRGAQVLGQSGSKDVLDSSMYVELEPGDYAIQVESVGGSTGTYELRILADRNFTDLPPALNSLVRPDGNPVSPPAGIDPPNTNLLYLDFFGEFDRRAEPNDFFSFNFDDRLNAGAYDEIPEIVDPFTGEVLQEGQDYFTSKDRKSRPLFSPAERLAIRNIWSIVAEDFKPFDINVTTEDLTGGVFRDGESFRMLITSYNPENFNWPNGIDEDDEFSIGFDEDVTCHDCNIRAPTLMGAAAFDSWAEGGDDIWRGPNARRNDQLGYIFANNHNTFTDLNFGDTPNSGRIMAQPVQIANTISMQFGQALGMRKFLLDGPRNNFIMQETFDPGIHSVGDRWTHPPFPIAHDWACPSGGSIGEIVDGGTWRPHDNPINPWTPFRSVPWEGGPDMPHRLTMGLNRVTWGQGRPCDWESLADPNRVQNDVARVVGRNDPEDQGGGVAVDNSIGFRLDDHISDPLLGPSTLGRLSQSASVDGVISELADLDYFQFQVNRDGPVTIKVDVNEYINNLDTQLRVFDADSGELLGQSSPVGAFDSEIMLDLVRRDNYLVEVSSQGELGELGSYELRILFPEPPRARDDQATTNEEVAVTIDLLDNDDPGDDAIVPSSVQIAGQPTNGSVTVNAAGVATYTPDLNFFGTDTFRYNVGNSIGGTSNNASVTIFVMNLPDPPVTFDESVVTDMDESITIDVLTSAFDPDDPLNVIDPSTVIVSSAGNGTATANPDGTITYVPNAGFTGMDSFTYRVSDTDTPPLTSAPATVDVRVNAPPTAVGDTPTTDEDVSVVIDVLGNDFDPDAPPFGGLDASTVTIVSQPTSGVITSINAVTGEVTYLSNPEFNGSDSFTYTVADLDGSTSNVATVDITILFVNDSPVAVDDFASSNDIDVPFDISVLDNDIDVDPETSLRLDSIEILTPANDGTATPNADGTVTYTPNLGFAGADTFTYRVFDNGSTIPGESDLPSNEATVSVRVGQPITISGYAYIDFNNDRIRQPNELPISDVLVRVTKVDGSFTFSKPLLTDANGFYKLEETPGVDIVPAGVYEITAVQPDILIDGLEALGTGNSNPPSDPVVVGNDQFTNIIMGSGDDATEFNFGELGLRANFVLDLSGRVFLASSGPGGIAMPGGVLSSLDLTAGEVLVSLPEGWDGVMTASAKLSASASGTVTIELLDVTSNTVDVLASNSATSGAAEITVRGMLGDARYLRLSGTHPDVTLSLLGGVADSTPPEAELGSVTHIAHGGGTSGALTINYRDNVAVDASSIDNLDVRISGPNGFSTLATAVVSRGASSGVSLAVDYLVSAPGGSWDAVDSGTYTIYIESNQVTDISGNAVAPQQLGTFEVFISATGPIAPGEIVSTVNPEQIRVSLAPGEAFRTTVSFDYLGQCSTSFDVNVISTDPGVQFENFSGVAHACSGSTSEFDVQVVGDGQFHSFALRIVDNSDWAIDEILVEISPPEFFRPSVPGSVVLDPVAHDQVDVSWFDSLGEDGYKVWRNVSGVTVQIATLGENETTYSDTGVAASTQYSYSIEAFNGDGSAFSSWKAALTPATPRPNRPGSMTLNPVAHNQVDVSWIDSTGEEGYKVWLNVGGTTTLIATLAADETAFSHTGVIGSTRYHYSIEAFNDSGSAFSPWQAVVTPASPPTSPASLLLEALSPTEVLATWTNSQYEDGYRLYQWDGTRGVEIAALGADETSHLLSGLKPDTLVWLSVEAFNAVGSKFSDWTEVSTPHSADLTGDGFVDFADLTMLLAHWNQNVGASDGNLVDPAGSEVDFNDLTVLLSDWTGPGTAASPLAAAVAITVADDSDRHDAGSSPQQSTDAVFEQIGSRQQARRAQRSSTTSDTLNRRTAHRLRSGEVDAVFDGPLSSRSGRARASRRNR